MAIIAAALAILSACLAVVFSMMIVHEVSRRGVKINFFLLRLLVIKYIHQYRQLTLKETGSAGPLYYPCIVCYNLAWMFAGAYFILR